MIQTPALVFDGRSVRLTGDWTLAAMLPVLSQLQSGLASVGNAAEIWDLQAVDRLDSAAAMLLWRAWGERWPAHLAVAEAHRAPLERVAAAPVHPEIPPPLMKPWAALLVWRKVLANLRGMVVVFGQLLLDCLHLFRYPREIPWHECSANLYKAGAQAMPVAALVGFLIGVTISYLASLQLRTFGAELFVVNLVGISIIRELGPVLVAVLVAGRSGSAMTAQIGVMRVTEEIDALNTMGISRSIRVVLPKIFGLTVAMPLLVLWTSAMAIIGGMLVATSQLDLSPAYFIETLPRVVPVVNLYIGLSKGLVFGFLISLIACHFGLRVRPNTESLAANTTSAVVTAITLVILFDAVFAVLTRNIGIIR